MTRVATTNAHCVVPMASSAAPSETDPSPVTSDIGRDSKAAPIQTNRKLGLDVVRDAHGDIPPLSASWRREPLSDKEKTKTQQILQACRDRDYVNLTKLASTPGGFIEDELRRAACKPALDAAIDMHEQLP